MELAPAIAALVAIASLAGTAACGHGSGAATTASATSAPTVDPDASFGGPLGACVTEENDRATVCDAFYELPAEQRDAVQRGCNGSNQRWVAACPGAARLGACKVQLKGFDGYRLQWSYRGKPPNDSVDSMKKICTGPEHGAFVAAP